MGHGARPAFDGPGGSGVPTRLTVRCCLLLFLVTLAVFSPAVTHGFMLQDDPTYVSANPVVQRGLTWDGVVWAFTTFHASNWHPLTWLSHTLDWQLAGANPRPHHFTSVLLHLANTVGLFLVLGRLTGSLWRVALVAALFALHPLHVESVAWVAERKDVLSTFFGILALGAYTAYSRLPRLAPYLLVVLAFALSLLAKPMLVTLPFVLLLLDYWPLQRYPGAVRVREQEARDAGGQRGDVPAPFPAVNWGRLLLGKVPLLVLSAASCAITLRAQTSGDAVVSAERLPLPLRVENAVVAYVEYLRQTVWPTDLAAFYPHPAGALPAWQVGGAALVLRADTASAVTLRRRAPALLVGWLWFLGTLLPVIGLVQAGTQARADRYTYLPLVGIFLAVAWAVPDRLASRRPVQVGLGVAAAVALTACAAATWVQLGYWESDTALWRHALQVTADNPVAHHNLGVALYVRGQVDKAEEHLAAAVRLSPNFAVALNNLGTCVARQGRLDEAAGLFTRAVEINPRGPLFRNSLGLALIRKGGREDAAAQFRAAIRLDPGIAESHYNLAATLAEQGNQAEAEQAYRDGLRLDPRWPQWANRVARELLTAENPKLRCPPEALFRARQAGEATEGKDPEILDTLATAYAETGNLTEAAASARRAVAAATASGRPDLARQLQRKLHDYEGRAAGDNGSR